MQHAYKINSCKFGSHSLTAQLRSLRFHHAQARCEKTPKNCLCTRFGSSWPSKPMPPRAEAMLAKSAAVGRFRASVRRLHWLCPKRWRELWWRPLGVFALGGSSLRHCGGVVRLPAAVSTVPATEGTLQRATNPATLQSWCWLFARKLSPDPCSNRQGLQTWGLAFVATFAIHVQLHL